MENLKEYYKKHRFFNFFLEKLQESENKLYFEGNYLGSKKQRIKYTEEIYEWIKEYKFEFTEICYEIYNEKGFKFDKKKYLILFYFYTWILNDILDIANLIKPEIESILNIGAGIGLIDILFNQTLNLKKHHLIELAELKEQKEISGEMTTYKNLINPKKLLEENMKLQDIRNIKIFDQQFRPKDNKYELIISLRSWGFLYPINSYIDIIKNVTNVDSLFIADIHNDNLEEFEKYFETIKTIKKYLLYTRKLFKRRF